MPAGWATLGAAVLGYAGASQGASAAKGAAQQQAEAASNALAETRSARFQSAALNQPYLKAGSLATNKLMQALGLGGSSNITLPNGQSVYDVAKQQEDQFLHANGPAAQSVDNIEQYLAQHPDAADADITARIPDILKQYGIDPNSYSSDPNFGSLTRQFSADDLAKDVPYNTSLNFGLDEGTKSINRLAAASGGLDSGAALKALTRYATDYAGTKASDAASRFQNYQNQQYGFLSGQQQVGQNAAATTAGINMNGANAAGNYLTQIGNANAAGTVGAANSYSSALGGVGNNLMLAQLSGGGQRGANPFGNLFGNSGGYTVSNPQMAPYNFGGGYNPES